MGATIAAQSALVVGLLWCLRDVSAPSRAYRSCDVLPFFVAVVRRTVRAAPYLGRLGADKAFPGAGAHPNGEARKIGTPTARKVPNRPKRAFGNAELTSLKRELTEALERQKATSDILNGINGSKIELQPVLDTIAHYRNSSDRVS